MSRNLPRLADYLRHILEAIERIDQYTGNLTEIAFLERQMVQDAVIRNFEIVGEACHNIEKHYPDFVMAHPEIPFVPAYEMRNAVAHGYFKVDLDLVWRTIHKDLPGLYMQLRALVDGLPRDGAA